MPETILGSISITPSKVRAGETVFIEVKTLDGTSYPDQFEKIFIGGMLTPRRYTSFAHPGRRTIPIVAIRDDGSFERTRLEIDVQPADGDEAPSLEVEPSLEDGARVHLRVRFPGEISETDDHGRKTGLRTRLGRALSSRLRSQRMSGGAPSKAASPERNDAAPLFVGDATGRPKKTVIVSSGDDLRKTMYAWDFGAGLAISTFNPSVVYNFESHLDMARPRTLFHVKVEVYPATKPAFELRRTISVSNPYFASRQRGVIRPFVRSEKNALLVMDDPRHYHASLTVTNLEPEALTLTSHIFEPLYSGEVPAGRPPVIDADRIADILRHRLDRPSTASHHRLAARGRFFTSRPIGGDRFSEEFTGDWARALSAGRATTIRAGRTASLEVRLPEEALPQQAVGFAIHYRGLTASGKQVRASAYFDIPGRFPRLDNIDRTVAGLLNRLVSKRLVANPASISATELKRMAHRSAVSDSVSRAMLENAATLKPSDEMGPMHTLEGEMDGEIIEGASCDPWNLPSVIPEGFVCQATDEKEYRWVPARFVNARQGDIIISPGGAGVIAALLRQVSPPQFYSHSGIMTRNQTEITHSTAWVERLLKYPQGDFNQPTEGLQPHALKFIWPGVIKQTVAHAVDGESMEDPDGEQDENGNKPSYVVSGFDPADYSVIDGEIVPALVVKVDPFLETTEIRNKLRQIGAFAAEQAGKSHYRLFCYTDPTIVRSEEAAGSSGWANGTFPSVCSSFIWFCATENGATLESSELEEDDTAEGAEAELPDSGEDGLYRYTAEERLNAGEFLVQYLHQLVIDSAQQNFDWAGDFFAGWHDVADDVSNQVANTFASDFSDTEAKDSDQWRETVDADAVSPDNLLRWDGPDRGGLWGSSEPLIYRTARYEEVPKHVWHKVEKKGSLHGTVLFEEEPVEQVNVELSGGQFAAVSDEEGTFAFVDIPAGNYQLTAYKVTVTDDDPDGSLQSTRDPIDIEIRDGQDDGIEVRMEGPDPDYREVALEVNVWVQDWEFAAPGHPVNSERYNAVAHVGPSDGFVEMGPYDCVCDNDVLGQGWVDIEWKPDGSVQIRLRIRLHDGPHADDDFSSAESGWKTIDPGETKSFSKWLRVNHQDKVDVWVKATNNVDQS